MWNFKHNRPLLSNFITVILVCTVPVYLEPFICTCWWRLACRVEIYWIICFTDMTTWWLTCSFICVQLYIYIYIYISRSSGNNRIRKVLQTKLLRKHDRRGTVVNLSSKVFSKAAFELLNKNLNFCPVPSEYNRLNLNTDLQRFFRRIKLRAHFDKPDPYHIPSESELFARRDKNWTLKFNHHSVDTFISCVTKELKESKPNPISHDNLSPKESQTLKELSSRDDIIITKADKGGVTVILDVKDYVDEANRQLQDTQYYRQLNYNPTEDHANIICSTLDEMKNNNELDEDIAEGFKPIEQRTPRFYLLHKIHKECNPGRPVISSVNCHTSKISSFVDYHIQDSAQSLKSYVKDTTDFINKLNTLGELPEESYLVTMDVKAL